MPVGYSFKIKTKRGADVWVTRSRDVRFSKPKSYSHKSSGGILTDIVAGAAASLLFGSSKTRRYK